MKIMATTSLPAVDRPNADRWNAARSRQKCLPPGFGRSHQLWQNKFFDSSTPSMRNVDNGELRRLCQYNVTSTL